MADYNSGFTGAQIDAGITAANSAQQPPSEGAFVDGDKTKLDSAVQPGDNISTLTNDAAFVPSDPTGVTGADAITNIISLTQAEYDAITPDASTFYVIVG
jgi:hypothetical protein